MWSVDWWCAVLHGWRHASFVHYHTGSMVCRLLWPRLFRASDSLIECYILFNASHCGMHCQTEVVIVWVNNTCIWFWALGTNDQVHAVKCCTADASYLHLAALLQLDFQARRRAIIKVKHDACIMQSSRSQQPVQQAYCLALRHVLNSAQIGLVHCCFHFLAARSPTRSTFPRLPRSTTVVQPCSAMLHRDPHRPPP